MPANYSRPVTFGLAALACAALLAPATASADNHQATTIREAATPFDRPDNVPAASDVTIRSLRFRPDNADDPMDTFEAMDDFHATRLEWLYLVDVGEAVNPEVKDKIDAVKATGRRFGGASNASSGAYVEWDDSGEGNHVKKHSMVGRDGEPLIHPHMKAWDRPQSPGCMNDPAYVQGHLDYLKEYIDYGATMMQRDEPSTQSDFAKKGLGCFGPHCMEGFRAYLKENVPASELKAMQITDIDSFDYGDYLDQMDAPAGDSDFDWSDPNAKEYAGGELQKHFVAFQTDAENSFFKQIRAGLDEYTADMDPPFQYTCNNTSFQRWDDAWMSSFDFAISELMMKSAKPGHIYDRAQKARSLGSMQVFGTPKTMGKTYDDEWLTRLKRQVISTAYASGGLSRVPWDIFQQSTDGKSRYFGKPSEFADLYGFVRGSHADLEGFDTAGAFGLGIEDDRYGDHPPVKRVSGSPDLCLFLRADADDADAPVMIHAVDWSEYDSAPFRLELQNAAFFPGKDLKVTLLQPAAYDAQAHADAEEAAQAMRGDNPRLGPDQASAYADLVDATPLDATAKAGADGITVVQVPAVKPWGILRIEPAD